jgi:putative ABC transport system ATP-binding protein
MTATAIAIEELRFAWPGQSTAVLDIAEFQLARGQSLFLQGASGSGKSSLLQLIAGILQPQSGRITIAGQALDALSASQRDQFRATHIGYVFQQFNLLPYLSLIDNVVLPCRFSASRFARASGGSGQAGIVATAQQLLVDLGLPGELQQRSVQALSVGQQQRVALARALLGEPELLICDEPTSAIDHDQRDRFMTLLIDQVKKTGASLLFVSHDRSLQSGFDRVVDLPSINQLTLKQVSA